eukprot:TRINITY_DN9003_c0_g1_i9.p1 TRINITY_DN9003_c0_g1~~TRINITY_DN9003_c0_g1_i9.p1  ORF type:complete len:577 (-),score=138.46 TRINITY_DN9003_c0_g1_i9:109-1839(-)
MAESGDKVASDGQQDGGGEKSKPHQPVGNRLYQPTAASVAKRKQVPATNPKASGKPGLNPGTVLRRSIKRTAETTQKAKPTNSAPSTKPGVQKPGVINKSSEVSKVDKVKSSSGEKVAQESVISGGHEDESRSRPRQQHNIKPEKSGSSGGKPDKSGTIGSEEKQNRDQTPDTSVLPTDRGVSTPTGEGGASDTILDSWDASQIVGVNKTQIPADFEADPCLSLKDKFAAPKPVLGKPLNSRSTMKKPLTVQKNRRHSVLPGGSLARGVPATVGRLNASTIQETQEDPDSISDEMMEQMHCRYIQSLYLKHLASQAHQKTVKECDEKLVASWRMLEQERQEVLQLEQELARIDLILDIQAVLNAMEPFFGPNNSSGNAEGEKEKGEEGNLISQILRTGQKLETLSRSLDHIKHNVEVKGIAIDKETSYKTALQLIKRIESFTRGIKSGIFVSEEIEDSAQMLRSFKEEAQYMLITMKECQQVIEQCRKLATKEVGLKISLSMAREAMGKKFPGAKARAKLEVVEENPEEDNEQNVTNNVKIDLKESFDGLALEENAANPDSVKTQQIREETPASAI